MTGSRWESLLAIADSRVDVAGLGEVVVMEAAGAARRIDDGILLVAIRGQSVDLEGGS